MLVCAALAASGCAGTGSSAGAGAGDETLASPETSRIEILDDILAGEVAADASASGSSGSLFADLADQARFAIDLASRVSRSERSNQAGIRNILGFDYQQVFSGPHGDWATMVLQGYLTRSDDEPRSPPFIRAEHDTQFQFRIFDFNYTGLARGRLNFKIGHVELPYGLETTVDTNGTLRQFLHGPNLGFKTDWGVTVNGVLPNWEYEVALTQGAGNEPELEDGRFLLTGRIGTPIEEDRIVGGSFMYARLPAAGSDRFTRWRVGVDFQEFSLEPFGLAAEVSYGQEDTRGVLNALGEVHWATPFRKWMVYAQVRVLARERPGEWDEAVQGVLGVTYRPDLHWSLSAQIGQDLLAFDQTTEDTFLVLQTRLRF